MPQIKMIQNDNILIKLCDYPLSGLNFVFNNKLHKFTQILIKILKN